ncbi:MAG: hypothetical protein CALGDGBN_02448 [Pseudomonadales bacterium]|nr:hypothetical protein [Pseudomonadales bacterium]
MQISVDISLYPLREEFVPVIVDFIHRVQLHEGVEVARNAMSTQLFGECARVLEVLGRELEHSVATYGRSVLVAKIVAGDVRRGV